MLTPIIFDNSGAQTGMGSERGTRSTVPHCPSKGLLASPRQALLVFVTSTVTTATGNRLPLVDGSAREASNLDLARDWCPNCHHHHSGARLDAWVALYQ